MPNYFDHEKLNVYPASIEFINWLQTLTEEIPKRHAVYDHLDRASTSIPLNIAEGNRKYTSRDRCRYFDIARGSALECSAALDVLVAKAILKEHEIIESKQILTKVVSMLVGLIKRNSPDRVFDENEIYITDYDYE